ncbi:MAG: isoprenylcysteine carboxylmethyltransferase family protein, partial [Chitinophagaceae bacterium]|nr:isoprenylcysteine carboxylmethyltransferase family protein [Chitinophagaceae bacterium]
GKADHAHDYIGLVMKVLTAALILSVVFFAIGRKWYALLAPVSYLERNSFVYAGLLLMHCSFLWIIIAQQQMKLSWRIGIDEQHKTALVTKGLFSLSRNPIFLGMIAATAGLFFVLPNALTFFAMAASYIVIQIQIRLEEVHLLQQHGAEYAAYKQRTKRLI